MSSLLLHQFTVDTIDAPPSTLAYISAKIGARMIVGGDHKEAKTILTITEPLDARSVAEQLTRYCLAYEHKMIAVQDFETLTREAQRVLGWLQRRAHIRIKGTAYELVSGPAIVGKTSTKVSRQLEAKGLISYDFMSDTLRITERGTKQVLDK